MICLFLFVAHSPDNSFLGFAVPRKSRGNVVHSNDRMAALVYGKDPEFWKVSILDALTSKLK